MLTKALGGAAWSASTTLAQLALQLGVLAVLGRLLTPRDFGLVSMATAIVGFATIVGQLGVGQAVIQSRELSQLAIRSAFSFTVLAGLLVGLATATAAPSLAALFLEVDATPFIRFLALSVFATCAGTTSDALLQREMRFKEVGILTLGSYFVGYVVVAIPLAIVGAGAWALVAAILAQSTTRTIASFALRPHPVKPVLAHILGRHLLAFGGRITMSRLLNSLALQGDNLVVARTIGATGLGFYSRGYQLMRLPVQVIGQSMANALFPALSRLQDAKTALKEGYLTAAGIATLLGGIAASLLVVTAPEIIQVLLGPGWGPAVVPFQVLSLAIPLNVAYKLDDTLAKATGALKRRLVRDIFYVIAILGGVSIGVNWGIIGAAAAVSIAILLNYILGMAMSLSITSTRLTQYLQEQIPSLLLIPITLLLAHGLGLLAASLSSNTLAHILISVSGTVIVLLLLVIALPQVLSRRQRRIVVTALRALSNLPLAGFLERRIGEGMAS